MLVLAAVAVQLGGLEAGPPEQWVGRLGDPRVTTETRRNHDGSWSTQRVAAPGGNQQPPLTSFDVCRWGHALIATVTPATHPRAHLSAGD